jgi:hypothetical protein
MITVRVESSSGGAEQHWNTLREVEESWITQQVNRRRAAGETVCVRVTVNHGAINVGFITPTCARSGGGGRPATTQEQTVIELWDKQGLNKADFSGGAIISFLKQLDRYI